jgi:hypothetical protein
MLEQRAVRRRSRRLRHADQAHQLSVVINPSA